jgi:hypothetical protein
VNQLFLFFSIIVLDPHDSNAYNFMSVMSGNLSLLCHVRNVLNAMLEICSCFELPLYQAWLMRFTLQNPYDDFTLIISTFQRPATRSAEGGDIESSSSSSRPVCRGVSKG